MKYSELELSVDGRSSIDEAIVFGANAGFLFVFAIFVWVCVCVSCVYLIIFLSIMCMNLIYNHIF